MNLTILMLIALPIALIAAAIFLVRSPDESGDMARIREIKARQAARAARQGGAPR